jgi:RNA polymerase sigma-70 factor (ECF subfamily)
MNPPLAHSTRGDWFNTTHWSVVLAAREPDSLVGRNALERLCQTYWYPLYAYVRRKGYSPEDAQDLTQSFFERVLQKNYLEDVNRDKGKFRAYLLACLKHFLSDQLDRQRAAKRGGGRANLPLEAQSAEERYRLEPLDLESPDKLYEQRWAETVLAQARARLREEFVQAGKESIYQELQGLEPGEKHDHSYAEIARRLGRSESAIKSAVARMRQRYGELVRDEIAQTVGSVIEIDEEIRHLIAVLT